MEGYGATLEDVIHKNRLEIANHRKALHELRKEVAHCESVIDLRLANSRRTKWPILADEHTSGSNHTVTQWKVNVDWQKEAGNEMEADWNMAPMTE
jgi:hypothetical protein